MKLKDKAWKEKWFKTKYKPIVSNLNEIMPSKWGSDKEPQSSLWLASLSDAMGSCYKEGMKVLDYGCGSGRYCNFLSYRLKNFIYYGLEPIDAGHAIKFFGHDPRTNFGIIGTNIEKEGLDVVEVVVLGSVFTHLPIEEFETIVNKFMNIIKRGGIVVFSVFMGRKYKLTGKPGLWGVKNCYPYVYYIKNQIQDYCKKNCLKLTKTGEFLALEHIHNICRIQM